jgi:hypothetical protein
MADNAEFIGFADAVAAQAHRVGAGGWIFVADSGKAVWFNLSFTPTVILKHQAIAGTSGKLI